MRSSWKRRDNSAAPRALKHRRRWRAGIFGALLLLAFTAGLDRLGVFDYHGSDWAAFDQQTYLVSRVSDGDTVYIRPKQGGDETAVRLLGVDAPELHSATAGSPDYWSDQATEYTRARALGKPVIVRLEPTQTRDRYGRLLAYLYLSENDMLNLALVRDGQAYADRRFKHTFRPQLELAEGEARKKGTGLWKDVKEQQMPPWRQRWLEEFRMGKRAVILN